MSAGFPKIASVGVGRLSGKHDYMRDIWMAYSHNRPKIDVLPIDKRWMVRTINDLILTQPCPDRHSAWETELFFIYEPGSLRVA